jgi:hypothetical protein
MKIVTIVQLFIKIENENDSDSIDTDFSCLDFSVDLFSPLTSYFRTSITPY